MTNRIILVRHGRSTANEEHDMYKLPDSAICLTMLGVKQAVNAGRELKGLLDKGYFNWKWHEVHAFSSNYTRAKQTGRIVLDMIGIRHVEPIPTPGLNERRFGGHVEDRDVQKTDPYWRPGIGGESMAECRWRFKRWYETTAEFLLTDSDVILFMHGEMLKAATAHLLDLTDQKMMSIDAPNAVPFIYERDPDTAVYSPSEHKFKRFDPSVIDVIR